MARILLLPQRTYLFKEEKNMKKLLFLAISAVMAANVSAQEMKREFKEKKLSREERIEMDINRFTRELLLSDQQAERFAATYREFAAKCDEIFAKNAPEKCEKGKELTDKELDKLAKKRIEDLKQFADLQEKYYDKFRKDLTARQTAKVLRLDGPCGPQPGCCKREKMEPGREGKMEPGREVKAEPRHAHKRP